MIARCNSVASRIRGGKVSVGVVSTEEPIVAVVNNYGDREYVIDMKKDTNSSTYLNLSTQMLQPNCPCVWTNVEGHRSKGAYCR